MEFTLSLAKVRGSETNTLYPGRIRVTDEESLMKAARLDHVCGIYDGNYRSIGTFLSSDVIPMDADNEGSDCPDDWMTPEKLAGMLPDVSFAVVFVVANHIAHKIFVGAKAHGK